MLNPTASSLGLSQKPLILAFGSGSALALAAASALLNLLEEHHLTANIQQIWGCSAGALVGTLYSLGMPTREIYHRLMLLRRRDVADYNWLQLLKGVFTGRIEGGLLRGRKLLSLVRELINDAHFSQTKLPLRILTYRLEPQPEQAIIFDSGQIFPALAASLAMPGLFPAYAIGSELYCDPTSAYKVPLKASSHSSPTSTEKSLIIATYCGWSGQIRERNPKTLVDGLLHAKEVMQWELTLAQLEEGRRNGDEIILLTTPVYKVPNLALNRFAELEEICRKDFAAQLGLAHQPKETTQ